MSGGALKIYTFGLDVGEIENVVSTGRGFAYYYCILRYMETCIQQRYCVEVLYIVSTTTDVFW